MTAQRVHAPAGSTNVAEQELYHRRRTNDLRSEGVLGPTDGVDDGRNFLHVAVFANRCEHVDGLQILILWNAGYPLDGFRRVARILLLHQLEYAARMLKRQIVGDVWRQPGRRSRSSNLAWHGFGRVAGRPSLTAGTSYSFIVPCGLVVGTPSGIKPGEQPVFRQLEPFFDDERSVCVV